MRMTMAVGWLAMLTILNTAAQSGVKEGVGRAGDWKNTLASTVLYVIKENGNLSRVTPPAAAPDAVAAAPAVTAPAAASAPTPAPAATEAASAGEMTARLMGRWTGDMEPLMKDPEYQKQAAAR